MTFERFDFPADKACTYCDKYGYTSKVLVNGTLVRLCETHISSNEVG